MREQIAHSAARREKEKPAGEHVTTVLPPSQGPGGVVVPTIAATASALVVLPAGFDRVHDLATDPLRAPPPVVEGEVVTVYDHYEAMDTEPLVPPRRRVSLPIAGALAAVSLALGVVLTLVVMPLLTATATITLTPATHALVARTTIIAVVPAAAPSHLELAAWHHRMGDTAADDQVTAHVLQPVQETQRRTVATTGIATQPAAAAHGTITFYNALPSPQTIDAGTLLLVAGGVPVLTTDTAYLPAAAPPADGITTVRAAAENTGPAGNLPANAISGPCCRAYVLAYSSAFSGGADARTYHTPTAQDIANTAAPLTSQVDSHTQAALRVQLQPGEALLPPACTTTRASSAEPGAEADQVTVTVGETCRTVAYNQDQLRQAVMVQLDVVAALRLGLSYHLVGDVHAEITATTVATDQITFHLALSGMYAYTFTGAQITQLQAQLAGQARVQAAGIVHRLAGVVDARIETSGGTLPSDPSRIHIIVVSS